MIEGDLRYLRVLGVIFKCKLRVFSECMSVLANFFRFHGEGIEISSEELFGLFLVVSVEVIFSGVDNLMTTPNNSSNLVIISIGATPPPSNICGFVLV